MSSCVASSEWLWAAVEAAGRFDSTIRIEGDSFPRMLRRYVPSTPYTREILFSRMLAGEPSILTGFPSPLRGPVGGLPLEEAGVAIVRWLAARRSRHRYRIRTGPTGARRRLTLRDIALKWRANQTRFGVTDLHIRHTIMEEVVAPDALSRFNLLPHSSVEARAHEMFSFVISSRGAVTDSHSDDPDSSNFCITGKKLWLAWETYEGMRHGLWDVERLPVHGRACFDMAAWLSLRSSRWFFVNPGETLFLPAHLTHKVVTLERYIGVGGFFVSLPNSLRLLSLWISRGPLWSKRDSTGQYDNVLGEIAQTVRDAILELRGASRLTRLRWGYDYLEQSAELFIKTCPPALLRMLWLDSRFRCVADTIQAPWPRTVGRYAAA